jgi:hypothetical protein
LLELAEALLGVLESKMAHPRVPQNITLEALGAECPRLADRLGAACTEETASRLGRPLLFNASRGDGVPE